MIINFLKKLPFTAVIKTKVGVKPINQILKSSYFEDIIIEVNNALKFEQIIAPPDFLKDKYTIIGKSIEKWPHYELVRYLDNNLSLDNCDYIARCRNGTLDFRKRKKISIKYLKKCYREKLNAIKSNKTISISVCLAYDNTYIIADGKHSVAMALYFNYRNLRFNVLQNPIFNAYHRWIFERIKNDRDFRKHIIFFKKSYEFRKKEINKITKNGFNK